MIIEILIDCPECDGLGYQRSRDDGHECVGCRGTGKVPFEPELQGDLCEGCGERKTDLLAVDDSDPEVGYYSSSVLCYECRTASRRLDAEAEGGLRPGAIEMLGIDINDWLTEGARPDITQGPVAPRKPVVREPHFIDGSYFMEGTR